MNSTARNLLALAGLATLASATLANQGIEVIFTKIPQHPTSIIPGALDLSGQPTTTNFRSIDNIILSPDGSRWVLSGRTQLPAPDFSSILLMGSGMSGTMFAQHDQPIEGGAPGEIYDFFGSGLGRFNNHNHFAWSARAKNGVTGTLQKVLYWDGTQQVVAFQQGDLINGLVTSNLAPASGFFGNSVGSIHLLDDGTIGSQDGTITGIHVSYRPAAMYGDQAFKQNRNPNHTFLGLDGIKTEHFGPNDGGSIGSGPATNSFYSSADGAKWLARGGINGYPSHQHTGLVVNGQVVVQQGFAIPGTSIIVSAIHTADMNASGDWVARGAIEGGGVWAMHNGLVVAATGWPIIGGSSELWGESFLAMHCNGNDDWVLVGTTNIPDPAVDTVMVINGDRVLVREGEEVNLTGPGITDGVFIGRGNNTLAAFATNGVQIGDDRMVYFVASLRDALGNDYNSDPVFGSPTALLRIDATAGGPCYADCDGNEVLNIDDFICFINEFAQAQALPPAQQISHYANCDGSTTEPVLTIDDFICFINEFSQGCP